jgi:hypothetical protein
MKPQFNKRYLLNAALIVSSLILLSALIIDPSTKRSEPPVNDQSNLVKPSQIFSEVTPFATIQKTEVERPQNPEPTQALQKDTSNFTTPLPYPAPTIEFTSTPESEKLPHELLRIHFIDVGQGDSILIK